MNDFWEKYEKQISLLYTMSTPDQQKQLEETIDKFKQEEEEDFKSFLLEQLDILRKFVNTNMDSLDNAFPREVYDFSEGVIIASGRASTGERTIVFRKVNEPVENVTQENWKSLETRADTVFAFPNSSDLDNLIRSLVEIRDKMRFEEMPKDKKYYS